MVYDSAEAVVDFLKTSTKERAVALRDLIIGGAIGVVDSGDANAAYISSQELARRTEAVSTKLLAVIVQDAGDDPIDEDNATEYVVIRIIDRGSGMRNIRKARAQIKPLLKNRHFNLTGTAVGGVISLKYAGRTGHLLDSSYAVHYEAIIFEVTVTQLSK